MHASRTRAEEIWIQSELIAMRVVHRSESWNIQFVELT
jgi:hypothetical protein